ncbi:hypothetical protein EGH21_17000 [Halomicroarcula sp. F13]|jgi:hypothetical protein|uniref:Secreted protein n=1 Tax=Haloarcula rubra TaxID=2487747 RepID=A0AAW4PW05_9EURY|nr:MULTISPECIES: hypothetical protein [Halobacteria]MBX0324725.1 hypothetical protein [Halomicroarcula rubra]MDS0241370.1 hypothetical protein [Haloferax sp. S2CR25]MDS0444491.1 hypothetical protein [Haloferax sp. S2CR25-2]
MKRRNVLRVIGSTVAASLAGCTDASNSNAQSGSGVNIKTTKSVLEKYQSSQKALDDGYQNLDVCIDKLGKPFVNPEFTELSYDQPQVLFYQKTTSGELELAGAEWFVPAESTDEPPELFGEEDRMTLKGPMEGHYPDQPRHYGLHGWLFSENPNGQFAKFNPNITC